MTIPIISDETRKLSRDYEVLLDSGDDAGIPLRGLFIIDPKGILKQVTINDLPVGRSVDEILRLLQGTRRLHLKPYYMYTLGACSI
jgi:alkyl hydroperoxide reductase subunit AhpC